MCNSLAGEHVSVQYMCIDHENGDILRLVILSDERRMLVITRSHSCFRRYSDFAVWLYEVCIFSHCHYFEINIFITLYTFC